MNKNLDETSIQAYKPSNFINFKSLLFSLLITGINNKYNFHEINKTNNPIINLIAIFFMVHFSSDLYNLSVILRFHHIIGIFFSTILITSDYKYEELIYALCNLEISNIFLNYYFLTNNRLAQISFILTFFYFRLYKYSNFLLIELDNSKLYLICKTNNLYNINSCLVLLNFLIYTITIMNIYWGFLIVKKINKKYIQK